MSSRLVSQAPIDSLEIGLHSLTRMAVTASQHLGHCLFGTSIHPQNNLWAMGLLRGPRRSGIHQRLSPVPSDAAVPPRFEPLTYGSAACPLMENSHLKNFASSHEPVPSQQQAPGSNMKTRTYIPACQLPSPRMDSA
ncbi:hypothetical protein L209DRAFT_549737 [Thermothelomyces heterothallicus CBS 203.75]